MGRKWEEKYNKYQNGDMDAKYTELQEKIQNKAATKEEYKELQEIEKTINNIPKVQNVLELREQLQKELNEIKAEIARIQTLKGANEEERVLDDEVNKISAEISRVEKELKNKDLTPEQAEKLNQEYANLIAKRDANNKKYQDIQKVFADNKKSSSDKLNEMSMEELNSKAFELSTKISKCNMVANNLMRGLPWDKIELNLDNWKSRKFTTQEKISEKVKTGTEGKDVNVEELGEKIILETERQMSLTPKSDFEVKHPRLAKIKNWFKEKFEKFKKFIVMDEEEIYNEENDSKENKDNEFKKYIKEVAEKGLDGINEEKEIEAAKKLLEKQKAYKKAAYERETEKFGKEYADRSYNDEDTER